MPKSKIYKINTAKPMWLLFDLYWSSVNFCYDFTAFTCESKNNPVTELLFTHSIGKRLVQDHRDWLICARQRHSKATSQTLSIFNHTEKCENARTCGGRPNGGQLRIIANRFATKWSWSVYTIRCSAFDVCQNHWYIIQNHHLYIFLKLIRIKKKKKK